MIKPLFYTALRLSLYSAMICGIPTMYHLSSVQTQRLISSVEHADQQAFTPGYVPPPDVTCYQNPQAWLGGAACTREEP